MAINPFFLIVTHYTYWT